MKWDKEKLLERFYCRDQDKLFKEAHLVNPLAQSTMKKVQRRISQQTSFSKKNHLPQILKIAFATTTGDDHSR